MTSSSLEDMMLQRRKIRELRVLENRQPYPQDGHRSHSIKEALAEVHTTSVQVCGRIRAVRGHGRVIFFDIEDVSGQIQIVLNAHQTKDFAYIEELDTGDFVRITGTRAVTKVGEESIIADNCEMLSKALRPLPNNYYGFANEEERYRRRYVDLIMNPEIREVFRKRSAIISSVRRTLEKYGFLEVETPTLQPLYGGANARPFKTHLNALSMEMYLKISDELYLKRLLVGGFDKVYEIDKDFRNEGLSKKHNPEFTMMECYAAYWDYEDMMQLTEEIYRNAAIAANGTDILPYDIHHFDDSGALLRSELVDLNFHDSWQRLTMKNAIRQYLSINVDQLSDEELQAAIAETQPGKPSEISAEEPFIRGLKIQELFEAVEPMLIQPTFITDFPRETTSLCKPHRSEAGLIERFEPYVNGMEIGNAYTELNDPVLQRQFMEDERGDDAHPLDEDFIEALEYGMPPAGGLGLGIDRMVLLLTNQSKIRDVLLFPIVKPRS